MSRVRPSLRDAFVIKAFTLACPGWNLPRFLRTSNLLESRRDPAVGMRMFLSGPSSNLLAPSFGGWTLPNGRHAWSYMTGISVLLPCHAAHRTMHAAEGATPASRRAKLHFACARRQRNRGTSRALTPARAAASARRSRTPRRYCARWSAVGSWATRGSRRCFRPVAVDPF